jgi:hypothetical protein
LRGVLSSYFHYYHKTRTHLALGPRMPSGVRPRDVDQDRFERDDALIAHDTRTPPPRYIVRTSGLSSNSRPVPS